MGDQQRQRYQVQLSLRQKYQQQLEQLRRDSEQKGTYNTDDYRKAEQALTESLNRQLNENRRYWQQLEVVQGNWKNGVLRAFQDFTVDADNTAETAEQVFSSAFSSMRTGWRLLYYRQTQFQILHLFCAVRYVQNHGSDSFNESGKRYCFRAAF
ncbi:lambda phage tail tape-measure family protein [Escherichia coli p0305293.2]|nr:lambda phage tail tape-measure family protein [Escherichia coli p0305293.2]